MTGNNSTISRVAGVSTASFMKSVFKFSISSWINFFISVFSTIIITRIFNPDVYGVVSLFNSASTVMMSLVCLGLDSSFIRFYNEPPSGFNEKDLLSRCLGIPVIFTLIIAVFSTTFFYKEFSFFVFNRVSWLITVLLFINTITLLILRYFNLCYRMSANAKLYTIQSVLTLFFSKCFVLAAALFEPKYETVITFNTIGVFVLAAVYFVIQRKSVLPNKIKLSIKGLKEVVIFALYSWPSSFTLYLNAFIVQLIISKYLGNFQLGIYASTNFFTSVIVVLQGGFGTYWAPFMYANYKTEQSKIKRVHNYTLLFVIAILSCFLLFQNIIYSLLGFKYHDSKPFFALVLLFPLASVINETTAYGISIAKKNYYNLISTVLFVASNLLLCFYLIPLFGIAGAAFALAISALLQLLLSTYFGQKYYRSIDNPIKTVFTVAVLVFMACANYRFSDNYLALLFCMIPPLIISAFVFGQEAKGCYMFCGQVLKSFFSTV